MFMPNHRFFIHLQTDLMILADLRIKSEPKLGLARHDEACRFQILFWVPFRNCFFLQQECLVWVLGNIISDISWFCLKIRRVSRPDVIISRISWSFIKKQAEQKSGMAPRKKFWNLHAWLGFPSHVLAQT